MHPQTTKVRRRDESALRSISRRQLNISPHVNGLRLALRHGLIGYSERVVTRLDVACHIIGILEKT